MIERPKSRFVKVRCPKCKNEQVIYGKASTKVKCLSCNRKLSSPAGGKSRIRAPVLEVLG